MNRVGRMGSLGIAAACSVLGGAAHAQENDDAPTRELSADHPGDNAWTSHRFVPTAHLGIATPYGAVGIALDVTIIEWIALEAGAGAGSGGLQLATMARGRIPVSPRVAMALGSGVSMGPYVSSNSQEGLAAIMSSMGHNPPDTKTWDWAYWHNIEVSVERRPKGAGLVFRGFLGYGYILNPEAYGCTEYLGYGCGDSQGTSLAYGGVGLGLAP